MFNTAMILAGGLGTRFSEYTDKLPKPMIEAHGKPLLEHIINIYEKFGVHNYLILAGYKIEKIIEYYTKATDIDIISNNQFINPKGSKITVLDTGLNTMTGGRLKQGIEFLKEENFYLTYGDGLADINLYDLTNFYKKSNTLVTVTAVRPPARFGSLEINNNLVTNFGEKNNADEGWINGGFFAMNKKIVDYLKGSEEILERTPLEKIAKEKNLSAYKHTGFWQPCDTIRELEILEKAMEKGLV